MLKPTCLSVTRRSLFGTLEEAARLTGVTRSTQHRAEAGLPVSDRTRRRIESAYGLPLEALQEPLLSELGSVA